MFAKSIIDSDAFLEMPISAQALYFHLAMRADDDGFVNKPKAIMNMLGAKEDDMNVLLAKKFLIVFDNKIVVIKHWLIHNYIRKDSYKETNYKDLKAMLEYDENHAYRMSTAATVSELPESSVTGSSQVRDGSLTQDRIGKDRLGKDRIDKEVVVTPLDLAMDEFAKFRKAMRKPLTDKAKQLTLDELEKLAPGDDEMKIAIINQSIQRGWQGVFPLKETPKNYTDPVNFKSHAENVRDFMAEFGGNK